MKITIIGAGAMGGTIGGYFSLGGADVRFVDPYREHIDKINADGLEMNVNGEKKNHPCKAITPPARSERQWILWSL